jgi:hypothetical protein
VRPREANGQQLYDQGNAFQVGFIINIGRPDEVLNGLCLCSSMDQGLNATSTGMPGLSRPSGSSTDNFTA